MKQEQSYEKEIRNLDISHKDITINSLDGSHLHRHVRIVSKMLAADDVKIVLSEVIKNNISSYIALLKFYDGDDKKVGELTTDVSKMTKMYDASFDHYVHLKLNNMKKSVR